MAQVESNGTRRSGDMSMSTSTLTSSSEADPKSSTTPGYKQGHVPPAIQLTPVLAPTPRFSPHFVNYTLLSPPGDDGEQVHITFGSRHQSSDPQEPPRAASAPPASVSSDYNSGLLSPPIRPSTAFTRRRTASNNLAPNGPLKGQLLPPPPPLCMSNFLLMTGTLRS
jgi:hypothetical protein